MATRKPELGYNKEALPHDVKTYGDMAGQLDMRGFETKYPYPFLLFAKSKLWDPTLLIARGGGGGGGGETQLVNYNIGGGGMTFASPIRKLQSDPSLKNITVGRGTDSDVIVPVSSVSNHHAEFVPPGAEGNPIWGVKDLGSRNGTWLNEAQLEKDQVMDVDDGEYLRLGGNLIAWFLYPGRLWQLLRDPAEMGKFTDL